MIAVPWKQRNTKNNSSVAMAQYITYNPAKITNVPIIRSSGFNIGVKVLVWIVAFVQNAYGRRNQ